MTVDQAVIEITLLNDEINDIVDESPINGTTVEDINSTMTKLESLRLDLRRKSLTSNLAQDHEVMRQSNTTMTSIKEFLKNAKDYKTKLTLSQTRQVHDAAEPEQQASSSKTFNKVFVKWKRW